MTFQSLNQLIGQLKQQKSWRQQQQFNQVLKAWPEAVGVAVAQQTRPTGMTQQVLQVATSTPAWSQTLVFERHRILRKLNQQLALHLTDIRFSAAQWKTLENQAQAIVAPSQALRQHPSFIAMSHAQNHLAAFELPQATAFERWAELRQQQTKDCPLCPKCGCPTPPGELKRWSACALCATKHW
ncbi:MAG: DUF721 domain-containing protein [Leptolyngbyaceae cyanobacterium SL_1_1]|nr:DUF721 domain-containing protein [Leptolyngbyaceae cyanobacterium RM1_1_2]NJO09293.1 DUF721 domain-containing protein [Leptolyngbyaceae cyanobacterium SL_1_1]